MERLTDHAIENLLLMSRCDYHKYRVDIRAALSELQEHRATVLTPEEIATRNYTLIGVMHFVDKGLDGDDLKLDEVNRAAKMREITLEITEKQEGEIFTLKAENERLKAELRRRDMPCEKCTYSIGDNCDGCKWWKGDWDKPSLYKQSGLEKNDG